MALASFSSKLYVLQNSSCARTMAMPTTWLILNSFSITTTTTTTTSEVSNINKDEKHIVHDQTSIELLWNHPSRL